MNMKWQIFPFKGHLLNEPQTMFKIPPRQSDFSFHLSYMCSVIESCLTPCNPLDYSPPGSSVHGIFQAGILEWVAISSSRGFSDPGIKSTSLEFPALQAYPLSLSHQGSPFELYLFLG